MYLKKGSGLNTALSNAVHWVWKQL